MGIDVSDEFRESTDALEREVAMQLDIADVIEQLEPKVRDMLCGWPA